MKKNPRKRGLSRLEKLLQDSIRHELHIKTLRRLLVKLSYQISRIERCPAIESDV